MLIGTHKVSNIVVVIVLICKKNISYFEKMNELLLFIGGRWMFSWFLVTITSFFSEVKFRAILYLEIKLVYLSPLTLEGLTSLCYITNVKRVG